MSYILYINIFLKYNMKNIELEDRGLKKFDISYYW